MELALPPEWTALLPTDRAITADDVLQLPTGPPLFELLEGRVVVSPSPSVPHAVVAGNLFLQLHGRCPTDLRVLANPIDWVAGPDSVLEPDLSVVRRDDVTGLRLTGTPLLVVEILSPSTRRRDLSTKRRLYEAGGVLAYWLIDPTGPRLTVLELDATGRYTQRADLIGAATYDATIPYPVTVDLARLLD